MHYQGAKVPLSEKSYRFTSAGIPMRSPWGSRYATVESRREKKEEKKFSFKMFVPASKPEVKPVGTNHAFYRPGAISALEPSISERVEGFNKIFKGKSHP